MVCYYKVAMMEEYQRENDRLALLQRYSSAAVSVLSFWAITAWWILFSPFPRDYVGWDELGLVPGLGFSAALSWVVFVHAEVTGMIIMSMMKDKWQAEARAEVRAEMMAKAIAQAVAQAVVVARDEALAEMVAKAVAGAVSEAVAREAAAQETIRDLKRQLREARGEGANGAEGGA